MGRRFEPYGGHQHNAPQTASYRLFAAFLRTGPAGLGLTVCPSIASLWVMPRPFRTPRAHLWRHSIGTFYTVWQEDGKPLRRSTGTKKKPDAERVLRVLHEALKLASSWDVRGDISLSQAVDEWVAEKERPRHGLQATTVARYRLVGERLKAFLPDRIVVSGVTPRHLARFLDHLEDRYCLSPSGIRKTLGLVRMLFRWMARQGLIARNPAGRPPLRSGCPAGA